MAYTTINKSTDHFNTVLYTGNTSAPRTITGVGFQADLNWTKNRSATQDHWLADAVRGSTKIIRANTTNVEVNAPSNGSISSFNADGYVLQAGSSADLNYNTENNNYVSWNWKANNSDSTNSDGSITSYVSANTTAGFSIVKYSGTLANATVGHGLGVAPKVIFIKCRGTGARSWVVYHDSIGNTKHLTLQETDAAATSSASFNDTSPTSSVFSLGTSNNANDNTTMVAYCFAPIKGYSKFGSYTGNGNADGTFVYTGFKPAFILVKDSTGSGNNWFIWDNKRDGYNVVNRYLRPNLANVEGYYEAIDILSNGFKNRNTSGSANGSETYIYMAFAESPFVSSGGIPTTAR